MERCSTSSRPNTSQHYQTLDSLRRKFASLHIKEIPTGDPLFPEDVHRAKHIRHKMSDQVDLGGSEEVTTNDSFPDECVLLRVKIGSPDSNW